MVPYSGFDPRDPPEVRDLVSAHLVENRTPEKYSAAAASKFLPRLRPLLDIRHGNFGGTVRQNAQRLQEPNQDALIYQQKLDERLIQLLIESGLAQQMKDSLSIRNDVAGLYMTTLASEVATHQNMVMATDDLCCDVSSLYFNTPDGTLKASEDGYALARLNTPFVQPDSLHDVPLDRVLTIRERYAAERRNFRQKMQTMAAQLEKMPSREAIEDVVEDQRNEVTKALTALKQSIDETKTGLVWNMLTITVPSGISAAGLLVGLEPVNMAILGATAVSIGLLNWYGKRRGLTRGIRDNPWHYLISLQGAVSAEQSCRDFENGMLALVFD